jgi:serralysin
MATPTGGTAWDFSDFSGQNSIDGMLGGIEWGTTTLSFSFPGSTASWSTSSLDGYGASSSDAEPWSADYAPLVASDKEAVRSALQAWSNAVNLTFVESADNATTVGDLRFAYTYIEETADAQAWAYFPGSGPVAGDVWFNARGSSATESWTPGSWEYQTVLHEIGHALGLKHPFSTSSYSSTVLDPALDSRSYTIMSYSAQAGNQDSYFSYEPTTPMILDIAALQYLYGAKASHNVGNTTYTFASGASYHQTLWDGGGTDTIAYQSASGGLIDLNAGTGGGSRLGVPIYVQNGFLQNLYQTDNIWIANGTVIENATGGSGNDTLIGNAYANVLNGGAGSDTLIGGNGNDSYVVDSATDTVSETATAATQIDTVASSVSWTLGANLERLTLTGSAAINGTGNALANTLTGNAAGNSLSGGAGNDTLNGGLGSDSLSGGSGNDSYYVDLASDAISETSTLATEIDTVTASVSWTLGANFERLVLSGSAAINGVGNTLANTLTGNAAANTLSGGSGNDTLSGAAGNDVLNGGAGSDAMTGGSGNDTYYVDAASDTISETSTIATEIDTVSASLSWTLGANLERLVLSGSAAISATGNTLANTLTGNSGANGLNGGTGNDTLSGGAGNDSLTGSAGNDSLSGGAGLDVFRFVSTPNAASNVDRLSDFLAADDQLQLDDAVFVGIGPLGQLAAASFRVGTAAGDANDRVVYNQTTGQLFFDADGSGAGAAVLFATLTANTPVTSADVWVV